jgi:glycosyltransferase involved in cell wall biosynthesis
MSQIKLLQLITGLGMGGAEKVVLDLSKFIDNDSFQTHVVSLNDRTELLNEFLKNNIRVTVINAKNNFNDFFKIIREVNIYVKKNSIQVLHAHMTHALIVACIIKLVNPSLKIVYTSHNFNIGSRLREIIVYFLKPLRDIDIIFSKDILKFFYKKNCIVIPNGIHIEKYSLNLLKPDVFTLTCIGRLEYVKNHTFLIDLANKLKCKIKFKIQIVGAGELEHQLKQKVNDLGLQNYVLFLGLRNDIAKILNESHCLLLPSYWEGLPIVLLESAASKLPIISTPVGSIPSLINNTTGILCELPNFEENIIEIYNNYDSAKQRSNKLYKIICDNFSIKSIVNQHEKIYKDLVKS